jgi:hypothetical protein
MENTNIEKNTLNNDTLCAMYLKTLNEKELKSYNIAKSHLGTSFQLEKSNGFLQWKNKNQF